MEEQNLASTDVQHIIRYGRVVDHSRPHTFWRYTVEGKTVEEHPASCVVEINGTLLVVTVIVPKRRRV